jgi:hypothetical protein
MGSFRKIEACRICRSPRLTPVLDLGEQALTGVFPRERGERVTSGPLRLVKCGGGPEGCGLLQLEHSYELAEMYGDNYGYRSGLNASMVAHLDGKVMKVLEQVALRPGDLVVDIGANDGTTLRAYPPDLTLVGIDPTGAKFAGFYPPHVTLVPEFFSAKLVRERFPGRRAKVVTSFAMFYDLEDPVDFMRQVHQVLDDDGIWVFEQSYLPAMLETNSYDTVCHEHLEFYALRQIEWMAERVGFRVVDVELNDTNGGSFSVTVAKEGGGRAASGEVARVRERERALGLDGLAPYLAFAERAAASRRELRAFVEAALAAGKRVVGLGASTKGNVLLQYCGFTGREIACIGEVNADKFGRFTPGTLIPIVSEAEMFAMKPDVVLVLPWHFRSFFKQNPRYRGLQLVVPLPQVAVV